MGGMDLWVSYPAAFKRLDEYINLHRPTAADYDALILKFKGGSPMFAAGGAPLGSGAQTHFSQHWVGRPGTYGGDFWPYIDELDVGATLHCAFEKSVELFATARKQTLGNQDRKQHATLWTCSQPEPNVPTGGLTLEQQGDLFRVAVMDLDLTVVVVISTPEPRPALCGPPIPPVAKVAYPIRHWRLDPLPPSPDYEQVVCGWRQVAHWDPFPADSDNVFHADPFDVVGYVLTFPDPGHEYEIEGTR
jgi:hypothetical protein